MRLDRHMGNTCYQCDESSEWQGPAEARDEAGSLEAAMWRHSKTAFRSSARRQVDAPSRKYTSSVVPSQTVGQRLGLVHAQAIKSDLTPLQSAIKLFVWAGISIKTFFFEELNHARESPRFYLLSLERCVILCCPVF